MTGDYDLVVIGSGASATTCASRCRQADWRVAIVDQLRFGGTCALRGCEPKKVLVELAGTLDRDRRFGDANSSSGWPVS